ncbi:thymidylate kinase isoform X1 [Quercus suber]|uniref:thymidylate kinase isoform X1 n=2 Tax=Quercus suber TaxID=58331 RepID=UPI000CE21F10|nr:thymidylate kinase-like isoform X1 [Quercus suber]POE65435.1 thymidylate kinase [Quercus suber]
MPPTFSLSPYKALNFGALAFGKLSKFELKFPSKCSIRQIRMAAKTHESVLSGSNSESKRGALIVLEGLDRSGKTSQSSKLLAYLEGLGHSAELWRFPDRSTNVGQMISMYLSNKSQLDDHTIHLLFSANRWEKRLLMETKLKTGTTLIVDRYSYSGVAFSSAKGLALEWCKAPEIGLLAPDLVLYLDIQPEKAAERGGYGGERYEQLEFQKKVAKCYQVLHDASWKIIDACQPIEDIEKQLQEIVLDCVMTCQKGKPLSNLWSG